jgi:hypothetical protein
MNKVEVRITNNKLRTFSRIFCLLTKITATTKTTATATTTKKQQQLAYSIAYLGFRKAQFDLRVYFYHCSNYLKNIIHFKSHPVTKVLSRSLTHTVVQKESKF